jgi:hypothetical protein
MMNSNVQHLSRTALAAAMLFLMPVGLFAQGVYSINPSVVATNRSPGEATPPSQPDGHALELNLELRFFKDLAQEHRERSSRAKVDAKTELSDWEANLTREFEARAAAAEKTLSEINPSGTSETNRIKGSTANLTNHLTGDEIVYLDRIQERLSQVDQELGNAMETSKAMAFQMQTNNVVDYGVVLSNGMQENARDIRNLQRERADLELKQLEFRAMRKWDKRPERGD